MALSIKDYTGPKIPQYITGTLGAGEMRGVDAIGEKFYVIESDGILTIKTNYGTKNTFDQRQGENADRDALYERLEIYNETGAPITFRIFYGFGEFSDGRADIIGTVSITGTVPLPTGASTAAKQDTLLAAVATAAKQDTLLAAVATAAKQATPRTEDAASAGGEDGIPAILVRRDDVTEQTTASGDFSIPTVDRFGAQITKPQARMKRTYSASMVIAPAANPTDVFQILGAANRIVEITKIRLSGLQTTAGLALFNLIKRSAANTTGTSSVPTSVPHDATDAAAAAGLKNYSVNPGGLGAAVGTVRAFLAAIGAATSLQAPTEIVFGENKPITLNSATEGLCLNMGGVTLTGGTLYLDIEWTETTV